MEPTSKLTLETDATHAAFIVKAAAPAAIILKAAAFALNSICEFGADMQVRSPYPC